MERGIKKLIAEARKARKRARVPSSGFRVGAALETRQGKIYTGCNIETASFGSLICAEGVALLKALSDGATSFKRIAVVADTPTPSPPCGICRQMLHEFASGIEVVMSNTKGKTESISLKKLLPLSYTLPDAYRKRKR